MLFNKKVTVKWEFQLLVVIVILITSQIERTQSVLVVDRILAEGKWLHPICRSCGPVPPTSRLDALEP